MKPITVTEKSSAMGQFEPKDLAKARGATLPMPKLIPQALQVCLAGGRLSEPEDNGHCYLKAPPNVREGMTV